MFKKLQLILLISFVFLFSVKADTKSINYKIMASSLEHPWSLAILPNGKFLVTERAGRLRIVDQQGKIFPPIDGVPIVFNEGQGGLLDVTLDPNFNENKIIYFSYAEPEGEKAGTAVAKAVLDGNQLKELKVIFQQYPKVAGPNHFGSRLIFSKDQKTLFITLGERFSQREKAQNIIDHFGTIVRIYPDGSIPNDNPFTNPKARHDIWSFGHRNVQGAALHPVTGELWIHEHGPRGGDEINISKSGKNYGWPKASYGIHYWLVPIKDEHAEQGFEEPIHHWTPSIAPSGMMFYTGNLFPDWKGDLFVGSLAKTHLARLRFDQNNKLVEEEKLLEHLDYRIRDVTQDKDGYIYVITDEEEGKIIKLFPKE